MNENTTVEATLISNANPQSAPSAPAELTLEHVHAKLRGADRDLLERLAMLTIIDALNKHNMQLDSLISKVLA